MTSAEPPTAVAPAMVPHQPPSLNDLSSSWPTSVTPPTRNASPLSGSPHAARPVAPSLGAALSPAVPDGGADSPPTEAAADCGAVEASEASALSPPPPVHAARIRTRTAMTATGVLKCFRIRSPPHRWVGALSRDERGASDALGPWAPGAESGASYPLAL